MSASNWFDLHNELGRNDENRNDEDFGDGDFPSLKLNFDPREHAHHMVTGHNAPHNSVPKYLTGRIQTQKTHCHNNLLNRKIRQHTFHPTIHCHG